jgi:hypothetical protein
MRHGRGDGVHELRPNELREGGRGMRRRCLQLMLALVPAAGCGGGDPAAPAPAPPATVSQAFDALDPEACRPCHADQVRAWSGSMHAYASDDPIFRAMNARGQRETGGALGAFCVTCHAPMALARGATVNGGNLASVPAKLHGVTCAFCHAVDAVVESHDGALRLATSGTFYGPIADVVPGAPHGSAYSPLHDRGRVESASACGACHDVRTPRGVDAERTFAEWQTTVFAQPAEQKTCGGCHMPATHAPAASVPGAPVREVHDHAMAALDLALSPFPEADPQKSAVRLALDSALSAKLCVTSPGVIQAVLENARIGHAWPTGAAHDRRAWLEVAAYAGGALVWSSPSVLADRPPDDAGAAALVLGETLTDVSGAPVRFLWEAEHTRADVLDPTVTRDPSSPGYAHARVTRFTVPAPFDRVTMRLRVTPVQPEITDALVQSGDLDPAIAARIQVMDLATTRLEWTTDRGLSCLP